MTKQIQESDIQLLSLVGLSDDAEVIRAPIRQLDERHSCRNYKNFFYDPTNPAYHPMKRIRVNFHFINSLDSMSNMNPDVGVKYANELLFYANEKLAKNHPMELPAGNDTPVHPIPFRYVLTNNPGVDEDGIYFHYVEKPYFINEGRHKNNYSNAIIRELGVQLDSVLNIFYMVHPLDSLNSRSYPSRQAGIALGTNIKLGVNARRKTNSWDYSGLLNHEIGHVLGLAHAWGYDGCDDTPKHPNCWNKGASPCDGATSNNVMDYNHQQTAYSPCQLAKIYAGLSRNTPQRKLVEKDWCYYDPANTITVSDTVVWNRPMDTSGDIIVEQNACLIMRCKVNMAQGAEIRIKSGGRLILDEAHLYNDCGYSWKGIFAEYTKRDTASAVLYRDDYTIEHVQQIED